MLSSLSCVPEQNGNYQVWETKQDNRSVFEGADADGTNMLCCPGFQDLRGDWSCACEQEKKQENQGQNYKQGQGTGSS